RKVRCTGITCRTRFHVDMCQFAICHRRIHTWSAIDQQQARLGNTCQEIEMAVAPGVDADNFLNSPESGIETQVHEPGLAASGFNLQYRIAVIRFRIHSELTGMLRCWIEIVQHWHQPEPINLPIAAEVIVPGVVSVHAGIDDTRIDDTRYSAYELAP